MKLKYTGALGDFSGYGEAGRHDVASLVEAGVNVTTEIPRYCHEVSDFGALGNISRERENLELGYKIKILHVTPNVYGEYFEPGKYHIGRVFWETNKLPLDFAKNVQMLDEIWTGSQYNADAIRNAGVISVPIKIITEAIDTDVHGVKPYLTANASDFKFYSIFEWTERKNPGLLLEAFWTEFQHNENVSLTIKTYLDNFQPRKKEEIDNYIKRTKKRLQLKTYPPVYLFRQLMDRHQIYRFHKSFDVFVSPHRGEGWGIPQMEAMLMSRPIISTNCGGIHEYLTHKKDGYLLPYKLVPVKNTRNDNWYTPDQKWAQVSVDDLRQAMRFMYENKEKAIEMGKNARKTVEQFSLQNVGRIMNERLLEIRQDMQPKV